MFNFLKSRFSATNFERGSNWGKPKQITLNVSETRSVPAALPDGNTRLAGFGFEGAGVSRLTASWQSTSVAFDQLAYASLGRLRARSRDLHINNDYVKRFLSLLSTHVIGPKGIVLRCMFKDNKGEHDKKLNEELQNAWRRWGKKGTCDVSGKLSFRDVQRLVMQGVARDGEAFVRTIFSEKYQYGMALQVLDGMYLDELLNSDPEGKGRTVRMGVEIDEWYKPRAYFFRTSKTAYQQINYQTYSYLRIPAEQIIHIYLDIMPQQTRGIPWVHTAMIRLKMLGGYEEAEVVAARVGACKMGFFKDTLPANEYVGDDLENERDSTGAYLTTAAPGSFERLPRGTEFQSFTPEHPSGNYGPFVKACLRGIASGLDVSYNSLANDMENVSYSSLRSALLEERDAYMVIQNWLIEHLHEPIYQKWLTAAALTRQISIKPNAIDDYLEPQFIPRRWAWVDPLKDTQANIEAIDNCLKSRTEVAAEQGRSIDDVLDEIKIERDKAAALGIDLQAGVPLNANDSSRPAANGAEAPEPDGE